MNFEQHLHVLMLKYLKSIDILNFQKFLIYNVVGEN